jgi:hypothetical protein
MCIRMCVVADRGMIRSKTMAELDARGIEYILGVRGRSDKEVRDIVLAERSRWCRSPSTARDQVTDLEAKEVIVGDWHPTDHSLSTEVWT